MGYVIDRFLIVQIRVNCGEDGDELDAASGYDGIQVQTARSGR